MGLHAVIMAGGSGTRFWPLSRKNRPKQFLPLASKNTLISDTASRLKGLVRPKDVWVVCGKIHAPQVRKHIKGLPASRVVIEPVARNTAPAIALASLHVQKADPEGILVVLPSDHHIADVRGFQRVLAEAAEAAKAGHIVTVGIRPHRPETGYGYIRVGDSLSEGASGKGSEQARRVAAFVEKPDVETAQKYLESGEYLWNGGIFVFRADVMLKAIDQHMPDMRRGISALQSALGKASYKTVLARAFPKLPSQSIDYGVMEKAPNIAVIPGDFGWSDVGSFSALPEVRKLDVAGNLVEGAATLAVDCQGCVVVGNSRPLAVVGMKDVVVVDAGDALLVVPKEKSQDVRKAVEALKAKRLEKFL